MLEKLISSITNNNARIVHRLSDIIAENKITSMEELKLFEDKIFNIYGNVLNLEERVKYVEKMYNSNPFEERDLTFDESMLKMAYSKQLKKNLPIEEKIKTLILLLDLLGKDIYFYTEAYNFIVNKEI